MNYFSFISIFISPILGLLFLNNRNKFNTKDLILNYCNLLLVGNIVTNLVVYIFKAHEVLYFTPSFFVKYSLLNALVSILYAIIVEIFKNVKVEMIFNEKK